VTPEVDEVEDSDPSGVVIPVGDLLLRCLDRWEGMVRGPVGWSGLSTGLVDLNELVGGLKPSTLFVVGGGPATGKSTLALGIAAHVGIVQRKTVLYFSLEHWHHEIAEQLLVGESGVNVDRFLTGRLQNEDWQRLGSAVERLKGAPIFIDDGLGVSTYEAREKTQWLKDTAGLALIVVDPIDLIWERSNGRLYSDRSRVARDLKVMAREFDVPVVAVSRPSRSSVPRNETQGSHDELRDFDAAYDADVVVVLNPGEADGWSKTAGHVELRCLKQRGGRTGVIRLGWAPGGVGFFNARHASGDVGSGND
jgi:replicative DNA helicase